MDPGPQGAPPSPALHNDLYQLTMAVGYLRRGMAERHVVCEAFVRSLPRGRSFLLVCGLHRVLRFLRALRFDAAQLAYLEGHPLLGPALTAEVREALLGLRFTGDVWAMPEGTVAFAGEPLVRVEAPLWQAQLVETSLLSALNHATMIASKAARIVAAAAGAGVLEFGTRRTHDEAAVDAARAAYVGGCLGTSNVEAGARYGVPIFGTAAHMWTMVHGSEDEAFDAYLAVYPQRATLLVDTYDTLQGTRRACAAARRAGRPEALTGVRVDCGLFDAQGAPTGVCREVRQVLDAEGFPHTRVVVSGDLNEERIARLLAAGEPVDVFGVGTKLVCSVDAPSLGGVYKVVQVGQGAQARPVLELSEGRPDKLDDTQAQLAADHLVLADERPPGEPLLRQVMRSGELTAAGQEDLQAIRARAREQLSWLPPAALLAPTPALAVTPSARLLTLTEELTGRYGAQQEER